MKTKLMKLKTFYISARQDKLLKKASKELGYSESLFIRLAINSFASKQGVALNGY